MKSYRLICDRITIGKETIIYNRHLIKSGKEYKTDHEKYLEQNIAQFYDFIVPEP